MFVTPTYSAEITLMATGDHFYPVVALSGKLVVGDDDKLAIVLRQARDQGAGSIFLRLDSPGGSVWAGVSIADKLDAYKRESHASVITVVGDNEMCASACFLIWLSGSVSTSGIASQLGVHGASSSLSGQQDIGALAVTTMMAKFFHERNVPDDVVGRMVVTAPSDMVWLKTSDLQRIGSYRNLEDLKLRESAQALAMIPARHNDMQTSVRQDGGQSPWHTSTDAEIGLLTTLGSKRSKRDRISKELCFGHLTAASRSHLRADRSLATLSGNGGAEMVRLTWCSAIFGESQKLITKLGGIAFKAALVGHSSFGYHLMRLKQFATAAIALLALALPPTASWAMDVATYKSLVDETLKELVSGKITDIDTTLHRQEKLMEIGKTGCAEYAGKEPKYAKLMEAVVADADGMKTMSPDNLEAAWGDEGSRGETFGIPLKSLDQFSKTRSYLDTVVHPATAYIWLQQYKTKKDKQALERAKGELKEVLEHLKKITA
eukprot:gene12900-13001_t